MDGRWPHSWCTPTMHDDCHNHLPSPHLIVPNAPISQAKNCGDLNEPEAVKEMMRAVLEETVPQMQQIVVDYKREVSKAKVGLQLSPLARPWCHADTTHHHHTYPRPLPQCLRPSHYLRRCYYRMVT